MAAAMNITKKRIALALALTACVASPAARIAAGQGAHEPSAEAVADSQRSPGGHRHGSRRVPDVPCELPTDNTALVGSLNHCDVIRE